MNNTELYNDLNNYDLITEMEQLGEMSHRIEGMRVDRDDNTFNHCLFESEVEVLTSDIDKAVDKFREALQVRRKEILKALNDRGVFEDDPNYVLVFNEEPWDFTP